ncbi:flagellar basal-body rod modification protein FlgD [Humidesulfovibrio mexicanus]|uniref:Basal-body rod modification protein FlgD n=1 Tax=Humidesulfovibrio mexicanus TaxID=147047 RepID=A0A239AS12_9BACT|nr:flagellar basal-body rod modification protein FlgD [Humidesulfovibrio mexicanus]
MSTVSGTSSTSSTDSSTTTHKTTLDQEDFMTILLAQLKYQDPNDPMDDKEMASQVVQYSNLEALNNINEGVQTLVESTSSTSLTSGVNYIGKSIKSSGYNLTVNDGTVSTLYYSLGEAVTNVTANVYDKDGDLIRSESLGSKGIGDYTYVWDGKDTDGNVMADGTYGVIVRAENAEGEKVLVQSQISGVVTGVKTSSGTVYLELADGRTVELANVTEVVNTAATSTSTGS